jgi:hypothetical protein
MNIEHLKNFGGLVQLECGVIVNIDYIGDDIFTAHTGAYMGRLYWNARGYHLNQPTDTIEGYSRYNVRDIVAINDI